MLLCLISTFKKKRTGWACLYQLPVQSPKGQRVSYIHGYAAYQFFYKKIGRTSIIISKCVESKGKDTWFVDGSHAPASRDIITYTRLFKGTIYYISIHARHELAMSRLHGQLKMAVFDRPFAAKIHHGISLMLPKAVKEGKFRVSFEKSLGISDGKKRSLRTRPLIEPLRVAASCGGRCQSC